MRLPGRNQFVIPGKAREALGLVFFFFFIATGFITDDPIFTRVAGLGALVLDSLSPKRR